MSTYKNKILILIGASCSGKSTFAENLIKTDTSFVNINRDDIRFALFTKGERDWTKYKFSKTNENKVTNVCESLAYDYSLVGLNIIISDTNLNPNIRNKWKEWAKLYNYEYEEKLFPCTWEELVKRNAQREGGLKESLLWSQYMRYMRQFGYYGEHKVNLYQENPKLPKTVWADIDGTVCTMQGRKPFEYDKVSTDTPRKCIITMLKALSLETKHITFMSGRESCCYEDTKNWIEENILTEIEGGTLNWDLFMRNEGDHRKDDEVKYEMYLNHIKDKFNVEAVLDDRYSVIRMQTVMNFPNIIQVGVYGNEF